MAQLARHPGGMRLTQRALSLCAPISGSWVDVGCGAGETVRLLAQEYGVEAVGVDIDEETVRGAAALGGAFVCADAHALPFADGSIDGVVMECCLCLMRDAQKVVAECLRVLKPGGVLCLSDLYARNHDFIDGAPWRIRTREGIEGLLRGFSIEHFEDCSAALMAYVGQMLLEKGREALPFGADGGALKSAGVGYCLLTAKSGGR
jgi:arsenite methyltransferase